MFKAIKFIPRKCNSQSAALPEFRRNQQYSLERTNRDEEYEGFKRQVSNVHTRSETKLPNHSGRVSYELNPTLVVIYHYVQQI